jgi:hypothetical protein
VTESIGWLAMSLICALVGAVVGAVLVRRRVQEAQMDRDM